MRTKAPPKKKVKCTIASPGQEAGQNTAVAAGSQNHGTSNLASPGSSSGDSPTQPKYSIPFDELDRLLDDVFPQLKDLVLQKETGQKQEVNLQEVEKNTKAVAKAFFEGKQSSEDVELQYSEELIEAQKYLDDGCNLRDKWGHIFQRVLTAARTRPTRATVRPSSNSGKPG